MFERESQPTRGKEFFVSVTVVGKIDDRVRVRHALISVSDKSGLEKLVEGLVEAAPDLRIFSTVGAVHTRRPSGSVVPAT